MPENSAEGEMIDKTKSGKRIKEVMRGSNISVKDLQKELGLLWPQGIYQWFRGESLPSVDSLYTLCRMTGVHMEDLLVEDK
jgi:transcriptional regulator with XRE-family HTH domain